MSDEWAKYEKAENDLKAFDVKHEGIKQALIKLGEILRSSGWAGVRFDRATDNKNSARYIEDDCHGFEQSFFQTDINTVHGIILQRAELALRLQEAFLALPESLQRKLSPRRQAAKSRNESHR
jgi:hypothetical protein